MMTSGEQLKPLSYSEYLAIVGLDKFQYKYLAYWLIQFLEPTGANDLLGGLIAETGAAMPAPLAAAFRVGGVSLAMNIGFHVFSWVLGTMQGLYPAALAKVLDITPSYAEAILKKKCTFQEYKGEQVLFFEGIAIRLPAENNDGEVPVLTLAKMIEKMKADEEMVRRLVYAGVTTPTASMAWSIPVSAGVGVGLHYAGVGDSVSMYALEALLAFLITKSAPTVGNYLSGFANSLYSQVKNCMPTSTESYRAM